MGFPNRASGHERDLVEGLKDRCPSCGSSNPWFTRCMDPGPAEEETGRDFPLHPPGCGNPWHAARKAEQPKKEKR
jgi:uncharacterized protein (DUF983 family)